MTTTLPPFETLSPDLVKAFYTFSASLQKGRIERSVRDLVNIRASQMNGCAFCLDMHVKEAALHGERPLRVHHVSIWRESTLFTPRERAALGWAETLTRLGSVDETARAREEVREVLTDEELSDLTFSIMAINGWNRISIGFSTVPGSKDAAYGLTGSGLD